MFKNRYIKGFFKWAVILTIIVAVAILGLFASVYYGYWGELPTQEELSDLDHVEASQIYDSNNQLIAKVFSTDREPIAFDELPDFLIHALLATEDVRFYSHNGVDERSMLRVFVKSIILGDRSSGGGSTITVQLAKNLYGRNNYGKFSIVINKIREGMIAKRIESVYSKNEILLIYLNTVPFSGNTYGIESASKKFYNKKTIDLNLSEAATLIGTLKANHTYNPRLFPDKSKERRDVVLRQMVKYSYISEEEAEELISEEIQLSYRSYGGNDGQAVYFKNQVIKEVEKALKDLELFKEDGTEYDVKTDGLKIHTTLDLKMQEYAESSMREHMTKLQAQVERAYGSRAPWNPNSRIFKKELKKTKAYKKLIDNGLTESEVIDSLSVKSDIELFNWDGAKVESVSFIDSLSHYMKFFNTGFIALESFSGAIKAYVGGIDYQYFQFDHVVQSKREVGSVFKPFVYTAALENGISPCDYFPVREITYSDESGWTPRNSGVIDDEVDDKHLNYSMKEALTQSLNTVSVRVLRETGIKNAVEQVHKMGIEEEIVEKPSMVLGVSSLRLVDVAKAYACYLSEGLVVTPYFVERIEDKNGNVIADLSPDSYSKKAFSDKSKTQMVEMLRNVVNKGTANRIRYKYGLNNDIAGKTGTTQNNTDGWFVGMLPNLVTVTWVGNDIHGIKFPNTSIGQGANSALPIFAGFVEKMNQDRSFDNITKRKFPSPSQSVLASLDCPPTSEDSFFKKLFKKNKDEETFEKKKKKGFFDRLFGRD